MMLNKEREAKYLQRFIKKTNKERKEWRASVQRQRDKKTKEGSSGYHSKIYTQVDGKTCLFEILIGYYICSMLLQAIACKKRIQRLKQEAKELSIKPIGDSRTNHLKDRGNDTIWAMKKKIKFEL